MVANDSRIQTSRLRPGGDFLRLRRRFCAAQRIQDLDVAPDPGRLPQEAETALGGGLNIGSAIRGTIS